MTEDKRTLAQNRKMWAMLRDFAAQVEWYGNRLSDEDYKNIFSAAVERQRMVPALDGMGFVVLGVSTRGKPVKWFNDMIELLYAEGADRGVIWSDPAIRAQAEYPEARRTA